MSPLFNVMPTYTPGLGEALVNAGQMFLQARRQKHLRDQQDKIFESQLADAYMRRVAQGARSGTPPTTYEAVPVLTPDDLSREFRVANPTLTPPSTAGGATDASAAAGGSFRADFDTALRNGLAPAAASPPVSNTAIAVAKANAFHQGQAARQRSQDPAGAFQANLTQTLATRPAVNAGASAAPITGSGTVMLPTTDPRYVPIPDAAGGGYIDTAAPMQQQALANALRQEMIGDRQIAVNNAKPHRYQVVRDKNGQTYVQDLNDPTAGAQPVTLPDGTVLTAPAAKSGGTVRKINGKLYRVDGEGNATPVTDASGGQLSEPLHATGPNSNGAVSAAAATGRALSQNRAAINSAARSMPKFPALSLAPAADSASVIQARTPVLESMAGLAARGDSLQQAYDQQSSAIGTGRAPGGAVNMTGVRAQLAHAQEQLDAVMRSNAPLAAKARAQEAYKARVQRLTGGGAQ